MSTSFVADFTFPEKGLNLPGRIAEMNAERVMVELMPAFELPDISRAKVDVLFMLKGAVLQLGGEVIQNEGKRATLKVCDPLKRVVMRRDVRHPCNVPVHFCTMLNGQATSVWREGRSEDISLGGICFDIPSAPVAGEQGEVRLNLTDMWLRALWNKKSAGVKLDVANRPVRNQDNDERSEIKPLRFRGKICYAKSLPNGFARVGMKFAEGASADNLRLARLLMDIFE